MRTKIGIEHERRFLVKPEFVPPADEWPVGFDYSSIEQVYLRCAQGVDRIRRRYWPVAHRTEFDRTQKRTIGPGRSHETVSEIQAPEFITLMANQIPYTRAIRKWRRVFEWDGVQWELDMFVSPARRVILEVEIQDFPDREINLPDFLGPLTEVTGVPGWSNRAMASESWVPPCS